MKGAAELSALCHPGTRISEQWISLSDRIALRVVRFEPSEPPGNHPIVFLSGLASVIEGFGPVLIELTRDFPVYYVDTREKSSARIRGKAEYGVGAMSGDLCVLVGALNLKEREYHLFGYSLGATVIVDGYPNLPARPASILLLEPNASFNYPGIGIFLLRFKLPLFYLLRPLVKWYIWQFRINRKEDYEMFRISVRSIDNAHPLRLRKTALALAGYRIGDRPGYLTCPALIIGISKNHFHNQEEVVNMCREIRDCTYVDLENSTRAHSAELGRVIRKYIKSHP